MRRNIWMELTDSLLPRSWFITQPRCRISLSWERGKKQKDKAFQLILSKEVLVEDILIFNYILDKNIFDREAVNATRSTAKISETIVASRGQLCGVHLRGGFSERRGRRRRRAANRIIRVGWWWYQLTERSFSQRTESTPTRLRLPLLLVALFLLLSNDCSRLVYRFDYLFYILAD